MRSWQLATNTKVEKGRIPTEFCETTGYHRDSAIGLLQPPPAVVCGDRSHHVWPPMLATSAIRVNSHRTTRQISVVREILELSEVGLTSRAQ